MYLVAIGVMYSASYLAVVEQVGVGTATARSMVFNIVVVHILGMLGT